jgi:hypothetical protein
MLGVDSYWERIHLAYNYEVEKRTSAHQQELIATNNVFWPGEIAFIEDNGTLSSGFYDFLEWQGMPLRRKEIEIKKKLRRARDGRWCLVVHRLDDGRYVICYLTLFNQAQHGENIKSSLSRLFAIAIDDTPQYPTGTPSIKLLPKWGEYAFLYAMPVPRRNLVRGKTLHIRHILRVGELERVRRLIVERVKVRAVHSLLPETMR